MKKVQCFQRLSSFLFQLRRSNKTVIFNIYKTRTNTIPKHYERGKISRELRDESLRLCEELRDRALFDTEFAGGDYVLSMGQDQVYAEARKRLGGEGSGDK